MGTTIENKRIIAIDILKVFAVLLVLNSHMELAYGNYSIFATGGAFGDALFFFASGFMLCRGPALRFDNFYKKRISRIYPTVIIVAIVAALLFDRNDNIIIILLNGGGWFVNCIMIYYAILWVIKRWLINRMTLVWIATSIIIITWFYLGYDNSKVESIYGETYFKWCFYFVFMLQGAVMGLNPQKYKFKKLSFLYWGGVYSIMVQYVSSLSKMSYH